MPKGWIDSLKSLLGDDKVFEDPEHLETYARDESGILELHLPDVVLHPESAHDVAEAVKFAHMRGIPLVPRGGGTGLTGGALAIHGGILVVFDRMAKILDVNDETLTARVQPGLIAGELEAHLESLGLFYPPDPASLESCTIGGNVAENASGPRTLKYGVTQHYILELETVVPPGELIRVGRPVKKWVVGYNLPALFAGSEGTLGVFTEITLRLLPKPFSVKTALLAFPGEEEASKVVSKIFKLGILPTALEFLDHRSLEIVRDMVPKGIPEGAGALLIVELDAAEEGVIEESLEKAAEEAYQVGALEILVAQTDRARERLWKARRELYTLLENTYERVRSEDLVVPRDRLPLLVREVYRIEKETGIPISTFGHAGDGNLHVNLLFTEKEEREGKVEKAIELLYRVTVQLEGTISGEHGIGILKKRYVKMEQPPFLVDLQKNLKRVLDPKGILNPGKLFE